MTVVYIAGPMTGIPEFNYPAFHAAAKLLRAVGYTVVSPAEIHGNDTERPWEDYLRRDLVALMSCDALALLPGWSGSRGARLEKHVADELGMPIFALSMVHIGRRIT